MPAIKLILALAILLAALGSGPGTALAQDTSICPYHFAWCNSSRYPRACTKASYQYLHFKLPEDHANLGFMVTGQYAYAGWTGWSTYGADAKPFSVLNDAKINPDMGSMNPFNPTTTLLYTPLRDYHILIVPGIGSYTLGTTVVPRLLLNPFVQIAMAEQALGTGNLMVYNDTDNFTFWALRVYDNFPGYNRAGAGGPTFTPYPVVRAFDLATGAPVNCQELTIWPPELWQDPNDLASNSGSENENTPPPADVIQRLRAAIALGNAIQDSDLVHIAGPIMIDPPQPDPDKVLFYRAPLSQMAAADVQSIPPPDLCTGYLVGRLDDDRVALIRFPQTNVIFDNSNLSTASTFASQTIDSKEFDVNIVGNSVGLFLPGDNPFTSQISKAEMTLDRSGGATFMAWPRGLETREQLRLFAYAREQGWNIMRSQETSLTSSNIMWVRTKGISPTFSFGMSPTPAANPPGPGAPCGDNILGPAFPFGDYPERYAPGKFLFASPQTMGDYAPLGVHCTHRDVLRGKCERSLRKVFEETGGRYDVND